MRYIPKYSRDRIKKRNEQQNNSTIHFQVKNGDTNYQLYQLRHLKSCLRIQSSIKDCR